MVTKKNVGKYGGRQVVAYTISEGDTEVEVWDLGARINAIRLSGTDIALGFNSPEGYFESDCYVGATIGRTANRIAGGRAVIAGKPYFLPCNEGKNHLHGGFLGFDKRFFTAQVIPDGVVMTIVSEDGDMGYPGKLTMHVTFSLVGSELRILYAAVSDRDTLWAPTCHAYFNLDGESSGSCGGNVLTLNADKYTPVDDELIPTGESADVGGTRFDFRSPKPVGAEGGYDHNYILSSGAPAAVVSSQKTGISMEVYTDMPCMQLYTGGMLHAAHGKHGAYGAGDGFCLEPQFMPNAVNLKGFEVPVLENGEAANHYIAYKFTRRA